MRRALPLLVLASACSPSQNIVGGGCSYEQFQGTCRFEVFERGAPGQAWAFYILVDGFTRVPVEFSIGGDRAAALEAHVRAAPRPPAGAAARPRSRTRTTARAPRLHARRTRRSPAPRCRGPRRDICGGGRDDGPLRALAPRVAGGGRLCSGALDVEEHRERADRRSRRSAIGMARRCALPRYVARATAILSAADRRGCARSARQRRRAGADAI
jgi:hypothetical protein